MANSGTLGFPNNAHPRKKPYSGTIQPFFVSPGSRVNKGDAVSFVNGGVQTGGYVSYGALQTAFTFQTNSIGEMDIDSQDDFFVIAYYDVTATTLKVICGQVSINDQISYGSSATVVANACSYVTVKFIGKDTFVVTYNDNTANGPRSIAGTINRVTKAITLGSPTALYAASGATSTCMCKLSDLTFAVIYVTAAATWTAIAGSVSGTTISLGSAISIGGVGTYGLSGKHGLTQISDNKVMALFQDSNIPVIGVITAVGTTLTSNGTGSPISNFDVYTSGIVAIENGTAYFWNAATDSVTSAGIFHGVAYTSNRDNINRTATLNGYTPYGSSTLIEATSGIRLDVGMKAVAASIKQLFFISTSTVSTTGIRVFPIKIGVNGQPIAEMGTYYDDLITLVATANVNCSMTALNSNRLLIIYGNGTTNGQAAVYRVSQGAPIGISVEQGESYGEVRVLTDGEISAGFGNLPLQFVPGADYFVDSSNNVSATPNALNAWIGTAISERWLAVGNRATLYRR